MGSLIDAHVQGSLAGRLDIERQRIEGNLRRVEAVYRTAAEREERASESKELTPLGRSMDVKAALKEANQALRPHRSVMEQLKATADATRARALQPPPGERSTEAVLIEREIRDALKADMAMLPVKYLDAVERGDQAIVSAVERSPFALIDEDTRRRAEEMKLAKSPLKAQLDALEGEHQIFAQVMATVENELGKLAERHGVRIED